MQAEALLPSPRKSCNKKMATEQSRVLSEVVNILDHVNSNVFNSRLFTALWNNIACRCTLVIEGGSPVKSIWLAKLDYLADIFSIFNDMLLLSTHFIYPC